MNVSWQAAPALVVLSLAQLGAAPPPPPPVSSPEIVVDGFCPPCFRVWVAGVTGADLVLITLEKENAAGAMTPVAQGQTSAVGDVAFLPLYIGRVEPPFVVRAQWSGGGSSARLESFSPPIDCGGPRECPPPAPDGLTVRVGDPVSAQLASRISRSGLTVQFDQLVGGRPARWEPVPKRPPVPVNARRDGGFSVATRGLEAGTYRMRVIGADGRPVAYYTVALTPRP
jgi:hypothetical protein